MVRAKKDDSPAPVEEKEDGRKNNGAHLRVPDHLKKPRNNRVPTGNPTGRRPGQKNKKTLLAEAAAERYAAMKRGEKVPKKVYVPTGKPRGRPKKNVESEEV